jgi:hypothetical protein
MPLGKLTSYKKLVPFEAELCLLKFAASFNLTMYLNFRFLKVKIFLQDSNKAEIGKCFFKTQVLSFCVNIASVIKQNSFYRTTEAHS